MFNRITAKITAAGKWARSIIGQDKVYYYAFGIGAIVGFFGGLLLG